MNRKKDVRTYNRIYYHKVKTQSKRNKKECIEQLRDALIFKVEIEVGKHVLEI